MDIEVEKEIIKKFIATFFNSIVEETSSEITLNEKSILEFFENYRDYIPFLGSNYIRKMFYEFIDHHQDILKIYGIHIDNSYTYYKDIYYKDKVIFLK
jgi:hypothetical protein